VAVPAAASIGAAIVVSRTLEWPDPRTVPWWGAVVGAAVLTSVAVGRLARRLLPLATLLRLSLVFPDRTPSRFRIALRAGTAGQLRRQVARVREEGVGDDVNAAAETVLVLAAALNAHDPQTRGHSERVRAFAEVLAQELHLPAADVDRLRWSALLHDCGKLMVHTDVLNKKGPLTPEEWEEVRRHPEAGAKLTIPLRGWLGPWGAAIEEHHERWDGGGYPNGLAGAEMSFGARIVAVADAYEVMTAPRAYKAALAPEAARAELTREAGRQFDPVVVRAFVGLSLGRAGWLAAPFAWLAGLAIVRRLSTIAPKDAPASGLAAAALVLAALLGLLGPTEVAAHQTPAPSSLVAAPGAPTDPRIVVSDEPPSVVLGVQFTRPEPPTAGAPAAPAAPVATAAPVTPPTTATPPTTVTPPTTIPPAPPTTVAPTSDACTAQALVVTAITPAAGRLAAVRARKAPEGGNNKNCGVIRPGQ
jgi:hypothetical protein